MVFSVGTVHSKGQVLLDEIPALWPLAHFELAVCSERMRNPKAAIANYSEFVSL